MFKNENFEISSLIINNSWSMCLDSWKTAQKYFKFDTFWIKIALKLMQEFYNNKLDLFEFWSNNFIEIGYWMKEKSMSKVQIMQDYNICQLTFLDINILCHTPILASYPNGTYLVDYKFYISSNFIFKILNKKYIVFYALS